MRDRYSEFTARNAEILAVGSSNAETFQRYWMNEAIPFLGLPDPDHYVARVYKQEVNALKSGRMPLMCILDKSGYVRYVHYGVSMRDIPSNEELLRVIDELNASSN